CADRFCCRFNQTTVMMFRPLGILVTVIFISGILAFSQKERTWTAIGDSITYLNEHPEETGNRISSGYMSRVVKAVPNLRYINQGHNGWSAVAIAKEIEKLGLERSDLYTIFLGTNDWWQGQPLGSIGDYKNNTGTTTTC